jgi:hypothetical protein
MHEDLCRLSVVYPRGKVCWRGGEKMCLLMNYNPASLVRALVALLLVVRLVRLVRQPRHQALRLRRDHPGRAHARGAPAAPAAPAAAADAPGFKAARQQHVCRRSGCVASCAMQWQLAGLSDASGAVHSIHTQHVLRLRGSLRVGRVSVAPSAHVSTTVAA